MDVGWFAWVLLGLVLVVVVMVALGWLSWLVDVIEHGIRRARKYTVRYRR